MTTLWREKPDATMPPLGVFGIFRAIFRGTAVVFILLTGVVLTLVLRLPERAIFGAQRPVTGGVTTLVCRLSLVVMRIRQSRVGTVMQGGGAIVSNHVSWLDILVLNAGKRIYFVSKAEVAGWPGIGFLARLTGTVFIRRNARDAVAQTRIFADRLALGHRLLFFPEGTSTDGLQVVPFKTTLFQAFMARGLVEDMQVQPVSLMYRPHPDQAEDFFGWWGDMALGPHLLKVLATRRPGAVDVVVHPPFRAQDFGDRKALAQACYGAVCAPFPPKVAVQEA